MSSSIPYEEDKSKSTSDLGDVVLAADGLSLDEEHKNVGGAPIEDISPIGVDVGWWTAVFLSASHLQYVASVGLTCKQIFLK